MTRLVQQKVLIIGLGLIGGSLARGLRSACPALHIAAADRDAGSLQAAHEAGIIDAVVDLAEGSSGFDLIVLALPPLSSVNILPELAVHLHADSVLTDVGSVKSAIAAACRQRTPELLDRFVPGHPIAGSERSGFAAANKDLFRDRKVILTPLPESRPEAVVLAHSMWRSVGAEVLGMSVTQHDKVLAATSHLPHLLAFTIVDTLLQQQQSEEIFRYAAGGFADFSRLASSDARMWADIFVANAAATTAVLDDYLEQLQRFRATLQKSDHAAMMELFQRAKDTRERFMQQHFQSASTVAPESKPVDYRVRPGGRVSGEIRVPGDKSISHRSVIFASLADGVTRIRGFLEGEDALNTVAAFRELGVTIVGPEAGELTVYGVGRDGLQAPRKPLYMGNSGTAMRLMAGLLAAQSFASELTGDESLNKRPMGRVAEPLAAMGAHIETAADGRPPMKIQGSQLHGIEYVMPVASAQVKSCLLLAGMYADGKTTVTEPAPCRDHTERMLAGFSYPVDVDAGAASVSIRGGHALQALDIDVPADISSAAFFLVAASISEGSELLLRHVGINPTRIGIINILRAMGATIEVLNEREIGGEPVADLRVRQAALRGVQIDPAQIPLAIDEFPVLFVAAACAEGETILRGAEELRVKESDRIDAMARGLSTLGIEVETFADGIRIQGGQLRGGEVDSFGDHRIAMAFTVAGLRASDEILIRNCANVATSFPGFVELADAAGLQVEAVAGEAAQV